jgi:hypothetical protein
MKDQVSPEIRKRAQESSNAIARMYVSMRHLLNRGFYKPMGISGASLRNALLTLKPEIYGTVAETKTELNGLHYIIDRLPEGITECVSINLTSEEGLSGSGFTPIVPAKRRRNCYRIDKDQMVIEITRGRSEVYDILTHLTFLYIEADKICDRIYIAQTKETTREWKKIEEAALGKKKLSQQALETILAYLAQILECSFEEVKAFYQKFQTPKQPMRLLQLVYHMGHLAVRERMELEKRAITFSALLRDRIGQHMHGEKWAKAMGRIFNQHLLTDRPVHIISANMHSVLNLLYAPQALNSQPKGVDWYGQFVDDPKKQDKVRTYAAKNGTVFVDDTSGCNVDAQVIDTDKIKTPTYTFEKGTVLLVVDYAFGEQAYELMDEFLKMQNKQAMRLASISIMGKAGILDGKKGDIMLPTAHIFEGSSDNYPFENELKPTDFTDTDIPTQEGTMITVLGTSLQNKDILTYFYRSTWQVIGLEMEGVHYQKAIQSAMRIRKTISPNTKLRYAYYASDNPLETGSTLASGSLGMVGVPATYIITQKILEKININ